MAVSEDERLPRKIETRGPHRKNAIQPESSRKKGVNSGLWAWSIKKTSTVKLQRKKPRLEKKGERKVPRTRLQQCRHKAG